MLKNMKESKEQIILRVLKDIDSKKVKGIAWIQREYGVGFLVAKEIYIRYKNMN